VGLRLHELRLDGGGVNPLVVEELLHLLCNLHVLCGVETADMRRRNDSVAGQLPDVELVDGQDPVHLLHQLPL